MLLEQKVKIKWNVANKRHYMSRGHRFTFNGDEFEVDIEDLTKGSHSIIYVLCDYCGINTISKMYKTHLSNLDRSISQKDACKKCRNIKTKESTLEVYGVESINQVQSVKDKKIKSSQVSFGVDNPSQSKEVKDKVKNTVNLRYNVDNVFQLSEIKEKTKKTIFNKYGVEYFTQTDDYANKSRETSLIRYGTENPLHNDEIKSKIKITNIERYGFENPLMNSNIQAKARKTMFEKGSAPSSRQQLKINELISGELNYPIDKINIDIAIIDKKIAIEYDGGGHDLSVKLGSISKEEFVKKELKRSYFLMQNGWKVIRIISRKDFLPSDDELKTLIDNCIEYLDSGRHYITIDIDNANISCSQYNKEISFKKLKQLSR